MQEQTDRGGFDFDGNRLLVEPIDAIIDRTEGTLVEKSLDFVFVVDDVVGLAAGSSVATASVATA